MTAPHEGWTDLFDGTSLAGWRAVPRTPVPPWPGGPEPDPAAVAAAASSTGRWRVEDGAIVGGQEPPGSGLGAYLVTEEVFGDVELAFEVAPDWPADTGVLLRASAVGSQGYQVLLDHRSGGGIGGFYGNGLGGFHALAWGVDVARDEAGRPTGLVAQDPATSREPVTDAKRGLLSYAAPVEAFLDAWRFGEFNDVRVRCVGVHPHLTTWVNGVKLYELDTAAMTWPHYDRDAVAGLLGPAGRIALEVHDNDPGMGAERWGPEAVVRWRRLRVRRADGGEGSDGGGAQ